MHKTCMPGKYRLLYKPTHPFMDLWLNLNSRQGKSFSERDQDGMARGIFREEGPDKGLVANHRASKEP